VSEPFSPSQSAVALPAVDGPPASGTRWTWRGRLLHVAVLLGIGLLLAWVLAINWPAIHEVVRRGPKWELLAAAVGLQIVETFNLTVRWRLLLAGMGVPLPFRDVYRMVAGSNIASIVMPGANGGDALKVALVAAATPSRTKGIASMLLDRVIGLCGLLLVGLLAGAACWPAAPPVVRNLTLVSGGLAAAVLAALFFLRSRWLHPLVDPLARLHPRIGGIVTQLVEGEQELRNRPMAIPFALLLAMIGQAFNIGVFYCMTRAMRVEGGNPLSFFVLVPFVFLSSAIPLPFGALGVTEGVSDQLFRWCGIEGGGLGMLAYRFAYGVSVPILLAILIGWAGLPKFRWTQAREESLPEAAVFPSTGETKP